MKRGYAWNGRSIATGRLTDSNALHELAHWLVCPTSRRRMIDIGLGMSPSGSSWAPRVVSYDTAETEESMASLLGISWERRLGFDWKGTARAHGWDRPKGDRTYPRIDICKLRDRLRRVEYVPLIRIRRGNR